MKKYVLLIVMLLCYIAVPAQILYTETFDNLNIGNVTTDATGSTPGQGGWYTKSNNNANVPITPAAYQIVTEATKGKVMQIASMHKIGEYQRDFFRTDVNSYWQQRTVGNNVLKIAFDFYTGEVVDDNNYGWIDFFYLHLDSKEGSLVSFGYRPIHSYIVSHIPNKRGNFGMLPQKVFNLNGKVLIFPKKMWITLECYIDYNNSNVYFSIPSLNYTIVEKVKYKLELGGVDTEGDLKPDDSPVALIFKLTRVGNNVVNAYSPKIDNINITAQNTVPTVTVSVNEMLASQFNLYPNPATTVVNISSAENMPVSKIAVYTIAGKLLSTQNFANETSIQLNTESLASGTYMLHIETNKGTAVKRLVKK